MNSRSTNKKAFESLIMGGAFDKLTSEIGQYFIILMKENKCLSWKF